MSLRERIERHEGRRHRPYPDTLGFLTVGVGRCIDKVPFSDDEIDLMLTNDIKRAKQGAESFVVYEFLNETRRGVLIEMVFQLGRAGVSTFKRFLQAALAEDWQWAHDEMLDSDWHTQTPERCEELAEIFKNG